jgi:hypothetical protein
MDGALSTQRDPVYKFVDGIYLKARDLADGTHLD